MCVYSEFTRHDGVMRCAPIVVLPRRSDGVHVVVDACHRRRANLICHAPTRLGLPPRGFHSNQLITHPQSMAFRAARLAGSVRGLVLTAPFANLLGPSRSSPRLTPTSSTHDTALTPFQQRATGIASASAVASTPRHSASAPDEDELLSPAYDSIDCGLRCVHRQPPR